jgi:hypothetical protein
MEKSFDAVMTAGGRLIQDGMRHRAVVIGGVVAGLVVVGLMVSAIGTVKGTPTVDALLTASVCDAEPISIVLGQDAQATMTVSPRTRCQVASGLATTSIEDFSIVEAPKHGMVMQRGRAGVVYQSDGDFRGKDSFTFAMRGKSVDAYDGGAGETSVVRVYVTVK